MDWRVADHKDYKGAGGQAEWDNGILPISLKCWDDFYPEVKRLLRFGDFIWRGQRFDWPLVCKFDRDVEWANRDQKLMEHATAFVRAIRGRYEGNSPPFDLNDIDALWAYGQHYGLPSPLLDWTESPFVAAYFAFQEPCRQASKNTLIGQVPAKSDQTHADTQTMEPVPCRFIYGLSLDIVRWGPAKDSGSPPHGFFVEIRDWPLGSV